MNLWCAGTYTPYGNPGDTFVLVVAATRDEAMAKATDAIASARGNYVPRQQRLDSINVERIEEVPDGEFVVCPK